MRLLRDFKCDEGHVNERFIDSEVNEVPCEKCNKTAIRVLNVGTILLDGTDPSLPGAYDKWARVREQRARQAKRQ